MKLLALHHVEHSLHRLGFWKRAAADKDGANPGDLPVEQPTGLDLIINLKTAKTLGIDDAARAR